MPQGVTALPISEGLSMGYIPVSLPGIQVMITGFVTFFQRIFLTHNCWYSALNHVIYLQETHVGPVPGMHSVESVEAEQRRWIIWLAMTCSFFVSIFHNYITEVAQLQAWGVAWVTSQIR